MSRAFMANKPKERDAYAETKHMQKPTGIYELPIQEKYMISLKEAGSYFNIGIKKMRRMAELNEGGFALYNGNRWLICRPKFEEYLLKLMKNPSKAAEVLDEDD